MSGAGEEAFKLLGLERAEFDRFKDAVASLDKGRSATTRVVLEELRERNPQYPAFRHYVLSGLLAKGDDAAGIAAFRRLQDEDDLSRRFSSCDRFAHEERGPLPDESGAQYRVVAEGEQGIGHADRYAYMWKLGGGSRIYVHEPRAAGLVVEGLLKRHAGDDESCVVEVEGDSWRQTVRFNGSHVVLGSTGDSVRVRLVERFVPFRLVVHRGAARLYVDGFWALHALDETPGEIRQVRFGLLPGRERIDTNFFWSCVRLCCGAKHSVSLEDLTPFAGYEKHLNNLAVAWFELGNRRRSLDSFVAALETHPHPEILANFVAFVERTAEDHDLGDPRLARGLDVVALRLGDEARARLRTVIQQKRRAVAVSCSNVSVYFARAPHRIAHPLELARRLVNRRRYFERNYRWVVQDVSFELRYGDVLAVIGNNGAGKSTLLRAIAGVVDCEGRVVTIGTPRLLVMGLGIQEELTARENILLGCLYLGLRRRAVLARTTEILEFAELTEFADVPYKYYSDGMKARLMFSIATSVEPDILLLDELLGAGDVTFRAKAMERMDRLLRSCKAMIVVTHNLTFVRERARKALYLDKGRVVYYGDASRAVELYLENSARAVAPIGASPDAYLLEEV
jgi:ABC-type polysaccharide/polyol phosphate transport system ATPase subunit